MAVSMVLCHVTAEDVLALAVAGSIIVAAAYDEARRCKQLEGLRLKFLCTILCPGMLFVNVSGVMGQ